MAFLHKHRLPSEKDASTAPFADNKESSIYSTDTSVTLVDGAYFNPGTSLSIHSRGHGLVRLPFYSSEHEIIVTDLNGNPVYTSNREKRSSSKNILSHTKFGDVISTSYSFGHGRDPIMKMLQPADMNLDTIKVDSKWMTRAMRFTTPDGHHFEWFYNKKDPASRKGEHANVLVLRSIDTASVKHKKVEKGKSKAVAKLIRNDATRTEGTSKTTAGNGGELVLDMEAARYLDESVIIATCLVMLKREVDSRKGVQLAVVVGAASSGGP